MSKSMLFITLAVAGTAAWLLTRYIRSSDSKESEIASTHPGRHLTDVFSGAKAAMKSAATMSSENA